MTTIHLIYGEPAAAALRQALEGAARAAATADRPDRVITLRDDLTVGPLRDIDKAGDPGISQRAAFWERLGGVSPTLASEDCTALRALEADDTNVVIWHTDDAAHQLALRRVCYRLRDVPQRLNEVRLAADEISGHNAPVRLEARLPDAAPISVLRITRLALEWQEAKFANGETRRWRDNTFTSGTWSDLDTLILDVLCANKAHPEAASWLASDALGAALTRDAGFTVGKAVVLWRLRELAAADELRLRDDMCAACAPLAGAAHATRPPLPQTPAHLSLSR
ncbi:DUF1835 domain-containing protein [Paraburkholderia lycopersici]|uniref:DUF1835 domain-containing protein n=1 Tax=Paraburkholderia lycopersici TaxID=416944 RepID=A0A1G6SV90_9BURK|nr:DUF1835 domain-containing protein [Paraburkholderia lycopersici]SDD20709.1 Protein of unknown function [Paraburkholderia lycopersici]